MFKVLSFSFDKGLLAPLVYRLIDSGLFIVQSQPGLPPVAASGPCHV